MVFVDLQVNFLHAGSPVILEILETIGISRFARDKETRSLAPLGIKTKKSQNYIPGNFIPASFLPKLALPISLNIFRIWAYWRRS